MSNSVHSEIACFQKANTHTPKIASQGDVRDEYYEYLRRGILGFEKEAIPSHTTGTDADGKQTDRACEAVQDTESVKDEAL